MGTAGFVLANGSMSSNQSGEGDIRKAIIEHDLVDCMIALPGQLFYSTPIPVCLWFITRNKVRNDLSRAGRTLFIDARKMGTMVDRIHRTLTDSDIAKIVETYHAWRGDKPDGNYADLAGFCASATLQEIRDHDYALTPARYVGVDVSADDEQSFEETMMTLSRQLQDQSLRAIQLDESIRRVLQDLGYGA